MSGAITQEQNLRVDALRDLHNSRTRLGVGQIDYLFQQITALQTRVGLERVKLLSLQKAVDDILRHCDVDSLGETLYERDLIALRNALKESRSDRK